VTSRVETVKVSAGQMDITLVDHSNGEFKLVDAEQIASARLSDVRDGLLRHCNRRRYAELGVMFGTESPCRAIVTLERGEQPWPKCHLSEQIEFGDADVAVFGTHLHTAEELGYGPALALVHELATRHGVQIGELVSDQGDKYMSTRRWIVDLIVPTSTLVADLLHLHYAMSQAAFLGVHEIDSPLQALQVVRRGGVSHLLGRSENEWLEAKRSPYDLKPDSDAWRIELAQDVAAFANAERGGLIVIGVATRATERSDVLQEVHPVLEKLGRIRQYHDALRAKLVPLVENLLIETAPCDGGSVLCIFVPRQPEALRPFVVDGGLIDGRYSGRMISLVRRRGEDNTFMNVHAVQAMLARGRAALARDHSPNTE